MKVHDQIWQFTIPSDDDFVVNDKTHYNVRWFNLIVKHTNTRTEHVAEDNGSNLIVSIRHTDYTFKLHTSVELGGIRDIQHACDLGGNWWVGWLNNANYHKRVLTDLMALNSLYSLFKWEVIKLETGWSALWKGNRSIMTILVYTRRVPKWHVCIDCNGWHLETFSGKNYLPMRAKLVISFDENQHVFFFFFTFAGTIYIGAESMSFFNNHTQCICTLRMYMIGHV